MTVDTRRVGVRVTDAKTEDLMARVAAVGAVVILILAVLALPDGPINPLAPDPHAILEAGAVEQLVDGTWRRIEPGRVLPAGRDLRVRESEAVISVSDGQLRLLPGAAFRLGPEATELTRGSLLVDVDGPWNVTFANVSMTGTGIWRVDAGIAGRLGVYAGDVAVADNGRSARVDALRELSVLDGRAAGEVMLLRYLPSDPWDARFLVDAIAVDRLIAQLQTGWVATYGTTAQPGAFYEDFLVGAGQLASILGPEGTANRFGTPAEVLAGLVLAQTLAEQEGVSLAAAAGDVAALRQQGAAWGLIAQMHGLGADDLRDVADRSLEQREQAVASGTATPPLVPGASGADPDPSSTAEPDDSSNPGAPAPSPRPGPPPPSGDDPSVLAPVGDIIGEVGGILGLGDEPSEPLVDSLGDVVDSAGELLDNVASLVESAVGGLLGG